MVDESARVNRSNHSRQRRSPMPADSHDIKLGCIVTLHKASDTGSKAVCVSIVENTENALVAKVSESPELSLLAIDEKYTARCNHDGPGWEFKTSIIAIANGEIYLTHGRITGTSDKTNSQHDVVKGNTQIPAHVKAGN